MAGSVRRFIGVARDLFNRRAHLFHGGCNLFDFTFLLLCRRLSGFSSFPGIFGGPRQLKRQILNPTSERLQLRAPHGQSQPALCNDVITIAVDLSPELIVKNTSALATERLHPAVDSQPEKTRPQSTRPGNANTHSIKTDAHSITCCHGSEHRAATSAHKLPAQAQTLAEWHRARA